MRSIPQIAVATSEAWQDKSSGERKDRTEWHRVVVFNNHLADLSERYLRKGSKVYLEGQIQTRKWTDQSGQEKYTTEVVLAKYKGELTLLDGAASSSSESFGPSSGTTNDLSTNVPSAQGVPLDDEIPF